MSEPNEVQDGLRLPGDEPSVLYSLWPEPERPLEEEVRLALQAAYPGLSQVDELEADGGVQWGGVYRFPDGGADVAVWAEPRGDLSDEFLEDALGPGPELEACRPVRWLLGVECALDGRRPQRSWQRQLQVAADATVPGVIAVYDDNALVIRGGRSVRRIAGSPVPPRAALLYGIHTIDGEGGTWVHTHGLRRAGLPEIDVLGVPERLLGVSSDLIDAAVEALLAGVWPDADGRFALGEGLQVRAFDPETALRRLPENLAGGRRDRDEGSEEHGGPRLVLLDGRRDAPPKSALLRFADAAILYKSRIEGERQRSLAIGRWGTFGQLFVIHRGKGWRFHIKIAFERDSDPEAKEHLWFEALELKPGYVRGRLLNQPFDVRVYVIGDEFWVDLARLTDYLIITPDGNYDPESAPVLLAD